MAVFVAAKSVYDRLFLRQPQELLLRSTYALC